MTIYADINIGSKRIVYGDSADRTADSTYEIAGLEYHETDTNLVFEYDGDSWNKVSTNSAVHVRIASTALAFNTDAWIQDSATGAAQADNTQVYESSDISAYNYHLIENTSSTDPVDVYISLDGTNYLASASAVRLHDATASTTHVVTIPAGDVGILEGKFKRIKVLKDGATAETPSIRYAHGVI